MASATVALSNTKLRLIPRASTSAIAPIVSPYQAHPFAGRSRGARGELQTARWRAQDLRQNFGKRCNKSSAILPRMCLTALFDSGWRGAQVLQPSSGDCSPASGVAAQARSVVRLSTGVDCHRWVHREVEQTIILDQRGRIQ